MQQRRKLLGTLLQEMEVIEEPQLKEALDLQRQTGQRVGEALQELGYSSSEEVCRALAQQFGLRFVDPSTLDIEPEVRDCIKKELAREHKIIAINKDNGNITIATSDPLDLYALDNVRFATNGEVECVMASSEAIERALNNNYGMAEDDVEGMLEEFGEDAELGYEEESVEAGMEEELDASDAPVIKLVNVVITEAVKGRTSDIHVEPLEDRLRIRYRVDGVCFEVESPPKRLQAAIITRLKLMAHIDIAEKRKPQDGRIRMKCLGRDLDLRVSCLPATHGESVVMRILDKASVLYGIQELGFMDDDYKVFRDIIRRPNGIFLVTGPTGSGKTTTLYAALQELNTPDRKIISAEEPVEYNISGINQSEVKSNIGMTFPRILRAMMRQAPNVILIGEIRDQETAEIAIAAALTGHLVFSTLHTNDAPSAITRLIDIGVAPFLVASSIQAVMAQRLVRTICKNCKREREYKPHELAWVGLRPENIEGIKLYEGAGCDECVDTGHKGRLGIFELMELDTALRDMAFQRVGSNKLREQARISGMRSLQEDAVRKVLSGHTTIEEVLRVTAESVQ